MNKSAFDVYGLGQCALDYLGIIPCYPQANSKCEFTNLTIQGGGPIATALVALRRWGYACAFSGIVGDDEFGKMILQSIISENVDISRVYIRKGFASQVAFAMAEPAGGSRTIFWRRPTGPDIQPQELDYTLLLNCRIFHSDAIFLDATLAACQFARENNIPVSIDAGSMRPGMLDVARYSDYFLASETFAHSYAPGVPHEQVCRQLLELGPRVVAVTQGERGYFAMTAEEVISNSAYKVDTIDTTGCGDLFHAGFIYGLLQKWNLKKCFDFAAWAAAMVSRYLGGREGIPKINEWRNYKAKQNKC
jgi:sulfofructose kinase